MSATPLTLIILAVVFSSGLLSSCKPADKLQHARQLAVQPGWHNQIIDCQQPMAINNELWQLQNLWLYLSDFSVDQQPQPLATNDWQQPQLVLLGTDCQGNSNWQVQFAKPLPAGQLSFTLGLPFAVNHQNPLSASPPLNHGELFWSWQLGYKFLRLDLQGPDHGWAFHLGSTGCQSASVLRPPSQPCRAANTVKVTLDHQGGQSLQLDLALLLNHVSLAADSSCMSDSQQSNCQQLFSNLQQHQVWQKVTADE